MTILWARDLYRLARMQYLAKLRDYRGRGDAYAVSVIRERLADTRRLYAERLAFCA